MSIRLGSIERTKCGKRSSNWLVIVGDPQGGLHRISRGGNIMVWRKKERGRTGEMVIQPLNFNKVLG